LREDFSSKTLVEMRKPVLILGVGGLGSRLASKIAKGIGCACSIVTDDENCNTGGYPTVLINTHSWINPSGRKLRFYAQASVDRIRALVEGYNTILIIANLAGKAGIALCPTVCNVIRDQRHSLGSNQINADISSSSTGQPQARGTNDIDIITFAIMPFKFEKNRIFDAGISLRRIRESSGAVVVIDNDSFLDNNPDLTISQCYDVTNQAIADTISSYYQTEFDADLSLLSVGRPDRESITASTMDSLAMLADNADIESVRRTLVHVMGGNRISIGAMSGLVNTLQSIFRKDNLSDVNFMMSNPGQVNVHLLSSIVSRTKFDSYDPLSEFIPISDNLDWDELECSPEFSLNIRNIE
jgi:cell division protein FtsZ